MAIRGLALTTVVVAAVFIAGSQRSFWRGWLGWFACLGLTLATGSRIASVAILVLPILNPADRNVFRRIVVLAVVLAVGVGLCFTPQVQSRFFYGESGDMSKIANGEFDTSGRFDAWPPVLDEALTRPLLGHGEGTVKFFLATVWEDVLHPHNDYLRLGYEIGIIGLGMYLAVISWQLWSAHRLVLETNGVVRQAFAAAWLGLAAFLLIAWTDNPIVYNLWFMDPIFAILGAAYGVARAEQRSIFDPYSRSAVLRSPTRIIGIHA
jgi:O-antigen ligase